MKSHHFLLIAFIAVLSKQELLSNNNFCKISNLYEQPFPNSNFDTITITVSMKNNNYSFSNKKNIKSTIAISKSTATSSWFKILTVHRDSIKIVPNSQIR